MQRIAENKIPEHYVEEGYLIRLLTRARLRLEGCDDLDDDLKLTLELIYQWSHEHRRLVAGCSGDMPIRYPNGKHEEAVKYFDDLTSDLAKWLQSETPDEPITHQRLEEGRKHRNEVASCYRQRLWY